MLIRPIVANVDYLAIQFAAKHPNIDFERINLLLLTAFYYKVKPIVIVNKIDYLTEEELSGLKEKLSFLEKISVPMFLISCHQNIGLEEVENFLKDKITVIGGPSGVGKSSFINFLQSERILKKTNNKYNCVVGDRVEISEDNSIVEIFKRDNMLIRPIVANVDYLAIQFAAKHPNIDFERINLLLLTAFYYKVKPIVIVNKIDYLTEEELNELKEKLSFLEKISVPMFLISCQENKGLEEVENFLKDKTTVIGGPSGVGKSSFINFLQSERVLKTGEISERLQRGKHTTRDSNMIKMKAGGYIIDTPGFSSIEVPNIENREELISLFPEFSNIDSCRFLNCSHVHEPGCNVKKEVEENKISKDRYNFYKKTLEILLERWNRYD